MGGQCTKHTEPTGDADHSIRNSNSSLKNTIDRHFVSRLKSMIKWLYGREREFISNVKTLCDKQEIFSFEEYLTIEQCYRKDLEQAIVYIFPVFSDDTFTKMFADNTICPLKCAFCTKFVLFLEHRFRKTNKTTTTWTAEEHKQWLFEQNRKYFVHVGCFVNAFHKIPKFVLLKICEAFSRERCEKMSFSHLKRIEEIVLHCLSYWQEAVDQKQFQTPQPCRVIPNQNQNMSSPTNNAQDRERSYALAEREAQQQHHNHILCEEDYRHASLRVANSPDLATAYHFDCPVVFWNLLVFYCKTHRVVSLYSPLISDFWKAVWSLVCLSARKTNELIPHISSFCKQQEELEQKIKQEEDKNHSSSSSCNTSSTANSHYFVKHFLLCLLMPPFREAYTDASPPPAHSCPPTYFVKMEKNWTKPCLLAHMAKQCRLPMSITLKTIMNRISMIRTYELKPADGNYSELYAADPWLSFVEDYLAGKPMSFFSLGQNSFHYMFLDYKYPQNFLQLPRRLRDLYPDVYPCNSRDAFSFEIINSVVFGMSEKWPHLCSLFADFVSYSFVPRHSRRLAQLYDWQAVKEMEDERRTELMKQKSEEYVAHSQFSQLMNVALCLYPRGFTINGTCDPPYDSYISLLSLWQHHKCIQTVCQTLFDHFKDDNDDEKPIFVLCECRFPMIVLCNIVKCQLEVDIRNQLLLTPLPKTTFLNENDEDDSSNREFFPFVDASKKHSCLSIEEWIHAMNKFPSWRDRPLRS